MILHATPNKKMIQWKKLRWLKILSLPLLPPIQELGRQSEPASRDCENKSKCHKFSCQAKNVKKISHVKTSWNYFYLTPATSPAGMNLPLFKNLRPIKAVIPALVPRAK